MVGTRTKPPANPLPHVNCARPPSSFVPTAPNLLLPPPYLRQLCQPPARSMACNLPGTVRGTSKWLPSRDSRVVRPYFYLSIGGCGFTFVGRHSIVCGFGLTLGGGC